MKAARFVMVCGVVMGFACSANARLGETTEQVETRYGKPLRIELMNKAKPRRARIATSRMMSRMQYGAEMREGALSVNQMRNSNLIISFRSPKVDPTQNETFNFCVRNATVRRLPR